MACKQNYVVTNVSTVHWLPLCSMKWHQLLTFVKLYLTIFFYELISVIFLCSNYGLHVLCSHICYILSCILSEMQPFQYHLSLPWPRFLKWYIFLSPFTPMHTNVLNWSPLISLWHNVHNNFGIAQIPKCLPVHCVYFNFSLAFLYNT